MFIFVQPAEKPFNQYLQANANNNITASIPQLMFPLRFHVLFSALYKDPDENFDPSLFNVPMDLNGSFRLPNMVFTEELLTISSNESQVLARQLEAKVWPLSLYFLLPDITKKKKVYIYIIIYMCVCVCDVGIIVKLS